jgi:HSP20 family molecular chaperone IbpA/ribosome-associated toxin RatA of RatAB toxin-antitoxin module
MTRIEQSIEVNVPAPKVYNQLTQFEDYPRFMEGVEEVRQLDDTHLHWRAKMNSHDMEWDAEIMEQVPDQVIAWRNTAGPIKMNKLEVRPVDQDRTKVTLLTEFEALQQQAQGQGQGQGQDMDLETRMAEHAVHDLMGFKRFIESRGEETGAWRAEVHGGKETRPPSGDVAAAQGQQPPGHQQPGARPERQQSAERQPPTGQQPATGRMVGQQTGGIPTPDGIQPGGDQAAGQGGASQQHGAQGADLDPVLSAMTSMNPQSWLPNILHAWEEPFVMMRKMTEDMDQIFERFVGRPMHGAKQSQPAVPSVATAWSPPLEVAQRDNRLVILAELPGVRQEDVHVEIKNDRLVIEGDRREPQDAGKGFLRTERNYGHFYRAIALPQGINPDEASASMRDGVLEIIVSVQQTRQPGRHVDIRSPG